MHYFGIPTCPYCKKRVNIIRVWTMKKHGEFMCPRCKGVSNIRLSPLVYVFAVLAVAAGFLIYFFSKFILDNVSLITSAQVLIPFIIFFILSLFFVYLEKPVIKKVRKTADGRFFDENGNELKMKMGKMVSAAEPRSSYTVQNRQASPPYSPHKQDVSMLNNDEDLYSISAGKTVTAATSGNFEPRPRVTDTAPATPKREMSPGADAGHEEITAGSIARSRAEKSEPNSGFEDLFQNYSASRPQPNRQAARKTEEPAANRRQEPVRRREQQNQPKKRSGGSRFRDL